MSPGKVSNVVPRAMVYCAAAKLHGVENKGAQPLLFCFYKWRA